MSREREIVERAAAVPLDMVRAGLSYGLRMMLQTKDVLLPVQSRYVFVGRLKAAKVQSDIDVAMEAIYRGRKRDIPELEFFGEAALAKTLIRAEEDPRTPDGATAELAGQVEQAGIDPELVPLLSDDDAVKAKAIMRSCHKVTHFFPNRQAPQ